MPSGKVEFKIEVMSDQSIKLTDADNKPLEEIADSEKLIGHLNKPIHKAIVTPMYCLF